MTVVNVSFAETLSIKVGRFLRKEYPHIAFASTAGIACNELEQVPAIGLLDANSASQKNWWWPKVCPRRRFMGVLWFSNEIKSAAKDKWILEVFGDQDINFLTVVAERLAQKYESSIHLKLVSESARYEKFESDCEE
jgi:hypothetical protein